MKKISLKVCVLILAMSLLLNGCSGGGQTSQENGKDGKVEINGEEITDLVIPKLASNELETFNILYSQRLVDTENLTNLIDPLLEVDTYGELVPAIAKEWGTEDNGLTWTFKLRDDVKWVDVNGQEKADCTADDFATGLEWILNFYKNDSSNTSMPIEMIKGAEEYYEWTKTIPQEEAKLLTGGEGSKFREMVGIEIPDANTLVYNCITEKPYFDSVAPYTCLYPMSQEMVEELGGTDKVRAMTNKEMWCNGAYTMTSYIQGNEKVFTKNPLYWDTESDRFETVTVKMVESNDVAFQLYQSGELDYAQLSESSVNTINSNKSHEFHDYLVPDIHSRFSYQFHFNFNKKNEDGTADTNWNTAIANKAFRLAWANGLNLEEYYRRTNALDPYACENNFYTMKGLVYTSDGRDYTELVRDEMGMAEQDGKKMVQFNPDKAEEYKKQAIEELTELGVTFPVEVDYYIAAANQTELDTANVLEQIFKDSLGEDFIKLNVKTYVTKIISEVIQPHLHSMIITGWGADYGDPQNYLGQEIYANDNAYFSSTYSYINEITEETKENKDLLDSYKEFTRLVKEADKITDDLDARYKEYAKAEAYLLENALVVPALYKVTWVLSRVDNTSKMNGMFGIQNEKMKNWKTSKDGYSTEEAEMIRLEHDKGRK